MKSQTFPSRVERDLSPLCSDDSAMAQCWKWIGVQCCVTLSEGFCGTLLSIWILGNQVGKCTALEWMFRCLKNC